MVNALYKSDLILLADAGTHLLTPEGWKAELAQAERRSHKKNIQISAKPGIQPGTLWLEGKDLTDCITHIRLRLV
mgnify:CR=1 FL=1